MSDETKSADESGATTAGDQPASTGQTGSRAADDGTSAPPSDASNGARGEHSAREHAAPAAGRGGPTAAEEKAERRARRKQTAKDAGAKVKQGTDAIRNRIASVVWLIAVVCALFLAVGALLFALNAANPDNAIVAFILDTAGTLDGPSNPQNGLFEFSGESAQTKNVLVNWGIAALAYLIVGKIIDRLIRP